MPASSRPNDQPRRPTATQTINELEVLEVSRNTGCLRRANIDAPHREADDPQVDD